MSNVQRQTSNPKLQTSNFSIYLHIPFCRRLCPFCHFYRVPEVLDWRLYLRAVTRELDRLMAEYAGSVRTLYVGGGTPTLLSPEFYDRFFRVLGQRFDLSFLGEATIETDGDVTSDGLATLVGAGFTRISIGIKSFSDWIRELLQIGYLQQTDPVAAARVAGFRSVGLDMVYGIKGQTVEDLILDLECALAADPDHISLYALEENRNAGPREGDADITAAMFRESMRFLRRNGYRQYEITNFARPGHTSSHNSNYWCDGDYLGLGPSAHSSMTRKGSRVRWRNRPEIADYLEDPGRCREEICLQDGVERAREALILGLRMSEGVDRPSFIHHYGFDPVDLLRPHLREMAGLGLLKLGTRRVRLTTRGMLLSNEVFVRIL